jgi:hypothetical protein
LITLLSVPVAAIITGRFAVARAWHRRTSGCVCFSDASVMPTITNGNINAPSMMIGERAAELIATATNIEIHAFGTN